VTLTLILQLYMSARLGLVVGTRLTQTRRHRDDRSTISANGNRNTDPRFPIVPPRHRRQRRVVWPVNVARSVRRLQRVTVHR